MAVGFARHLAERFGCAVDVALDAPDREGDQRNWHAHLLATTRRVMAGKLGEKCAIELRDAKRLSLGLPRARVEITNIRTEWAATVNRALEHAGRPERVERVDHRTFQREGNGEGRATADDGT